ncbi:hypothetical protein V501_04504 [Pseudogymnoascus sp. VKM F-4519 (FW-2642)]|nr:hypothetical protein V501_04504 [Pseudogymnoascus sp. VKM F-4519 (FW-2642)]
MHYRLGREECVFGGEKGGCETRFDIDIERELGGGGRQIRRAEYERVTAPGQMQIMEMPSGNAERSGGGIGATTMGRKVSKKDRRKSSREIEEAIARVEARFAAINLESSRRAAIEDALRSAGHAYVAAPSRSDDDSEIPAQQTRLGAASGLSTETEHQMSNYHIPRNRFGPGQLSSSGYSSPHFGAQVPPGNAYIGYQFGNEAVGHEALPGANLNNTKEEYDSGRQLHEARLPGEGKVAVQNYIGTTKYYPDKEQLRSASWDELTASVKYNPGGVVPRGPRARQERNIQFRGAAQQFMSQISPSNFSDPALGMSAPPMDGFRDSQSAPSAPHVLPTSPLASVSHPIFDGVNEYSPPNRPYRGPAIVSSDMANTGDT